MPTPIDLLLDPVSLMIISIYGALMLWEAVFPGRALPRVRYWKLKGLMAFVFYFFLSSYLPVFILLASSPDADPATKQYVRQLRGELG